MWVGTRDLGVIGRDLRFHPFAPPRARLRSVVETEQVEAVSGMLPV